jgi:hypothetical protein
VPGAPGEGSAAPAAPAATAPPSPAAAPSPSRAADADAAAAAAVAAAENEVTARTVAEAMGQQFKLNLYGFADVGYTQPITHNSLNAPFSTFLVGNLNLYMGAELGDNWRSLIEVRFTYLPNGSSSPYGPSARVDTLVSDYTDVSRPVQWGGVIIERAWLERTFHPLLTVRAGQFLTPYGIWNVDHGSPVVIGVRRPYIIGQSLFPSSQTGLELYGSTSVGSTEVGYHLTLSNGRGPVSTYQALDDNKAVGGRLFARNTSSFGTLTVGGSVYRGNYTDRTENFGATSSGSLLITWPLTQQHDELSLGADVKWEYKGLLVQSEAILNDVAYNDSVRPQVSIPGVPPGFVPNFRQWGAYGLIGYRTPFFGVMPWVSSEYYLDPLPVFSKVCDVSGGLNVRPTPRVVLKAQLTHVFFLNWVAGPNYPAPLPNIDFIDLQAAWSF